MLPLAFMYAICFARPVHTRVIPNSLRAALEDHNGEGTHHYLEILSE